MEHYPRKYSLLQDLLEDQQRQSQKRSSSTNTWKCPKDMIDLVCKGGHKVLVHKVLLFASPYLKELLTAQQKTDCLMSLDEFDVNSVEKFCRLLYLGCTTLAQTEIEDVNLICQYLEFDIPKQTKRAEQQIRGSTSLVIMRNDTSSQPDVNEQSTTIIVTPSPTRTRNQSNREEKTKSEKTLEPPIGKNKKRKTRRARNEQSNLSGAGPSGAVLQDVNRNKKPGGNIISSSSDESESGKKTRNKGRYEKACMEEFAPNDSSMEDSSNENEEYNSNAESDSNSGVAQSRIRTRNRFAQHQENLGIGRGRARRSTAQSQTQPEMFGTSVEPPRCYFCAVSFDEHGLTQHLNDPQNSCGNLLAGKFSFESHYCDWCKQRLDTHITHWGYIRHLHLCSTSVNASISRSNAQLAQPPGDDNDHHQIHSQSTSKRSGGTSGRKKESTSRCQQHLQSNRSGNKNEKQAVVNEVDDDDSSDCSDGSISTDVEKFNLDHITIFAKIPLKKALQKRNAARQREGQRIKELKERPSGSAAAKTTQQESSQYCIKRKPGPASKTGRKSLKLTFLRKPSGEHQNNESRNLETTAASADRTTLPLNSEKPVEPPVVPSDTGSSALTNAKRGKIKELFRCTICYQDYDNVHNATRCRWTKGMQLCWICQQVFIIGEKCGTFEQFEYCNQRFRSHCTSAEHSFVYGGETVVNCPYCGELILIALIHEHIECLHVRDYEIDKEVKKANRAKARAPANVIPDESDIPDAPMDIDPVLAAGTLEFCPDLPAPASDPAALPLPLTQKSTGITDKQQRKSKTSSVSSGISSTSGPSAKRAKLRYSNSQLRYMINMVVQQTRENNRNATAERVRDGICLFAKEQRKLEDQSSNPDAEKAVDYEEVGLPRIANLLKEMANDGILKYSEAKKAYKRAHRPEATPQWTDKKLKRFVKRTLRDLQHLSPSSEGFDLDIIEEHIKHAFTFNPSVLGISESLRKMLERTLKSEMENDNVEVVNGSLYRLAQGRGSPEPTQNTASAAVEKEKPLGPENEKSKPAAPTKVPSSDNSVPSGLVLHPRPIENASAVEPESQKSIPAAANAINPPKAKVIQDLPAVESEKQRTSTEKKSATPVGIPSAVPPTQQPKSQLNSFNLNLNFVGPAKINPSSKNSSATSTPTLAPTSQSHPNFPNNAKPPPSIPKVSPTAAVISTSAPSKISSVPVPRPAPPEVSKNLNVNTHNTQQQKGFGIGPAAKTNAPAQPQPPPKINPVAPTLKTQQQKAFGVGTTSRTNTFAQPQPPPKVAPAAPTVNTQQQTVFRTGASTKTNVPAQPQPPPKAAPAAPTVNTQQQAVFGTGAPTKTNVPAQPQPPANVNLVAPTVKVTTNPKLVGKPENEPPKIKSEPRSNEERVNRYKRIGQNVLKAIIKAPRVPLATSTPIQQSNPNLPVRARQRIDVPIVPEKVPDPEPVPAPVSNDPPTPVEPASPAPELTSTMVSTGNGTATKCMECGMEYEDADAADYHVCW